MNGMNISVTVTTTSETFEFNRHRTYLEIFAKNGGSGAVISIDDVEAFTLTEGEWYAPPQRIYE